MLRMYSSTQTSGITPRDFTIFESSTASGDLNVIKKVGYLIKY
jgi:hypothetical protein